MGMVATLPPPPSRPDHIAKQSFPRFFAVHGVAQVAASATCVPTAQEVAGNVALDSSASSGFATPVGSKPPTGATQRRRHTPDVTTQLLTQSVSSELSPGCEPRGFRAPASFEGLAGHLGRSSPRSHQSLFGRHCRCPRTD